MKGLGMIAVFLSVLFMASTGWTLGYTLRCAGVIIKQGDTEYKVLKRCGEPIYRDGNLWYYDSPGELFKEVTFVNGKVRIIKVGDRD